MTSPRRSRIDLGSPTETAIRAAMQAVEEAGGHPLLTDAVNLLSKAQSKVADWVDKDDPTQAEFIGFPKDLSPEPVANQKACEFIENWFAPWGSWKTAWWEMAVSDGVEMSDANALKALRKLLAT